MPYRSWLVRESFISVSIDMAKLGKGFNFLSHGSQDLYPTYLKTGKGFDNRHAIVATIIGNCGAITCVTHFHFLIGRTYNNFLFSRQRRRHCRFHIPAHRSAADDYFVCHVKRCFHSALDTSLWFQCACCWRFLCTIRRTRSLGCYPYSARGDESTWIPCYLPGCRVPTRKRTPHRKLQ